MHEVWTLSDGRVGMRNQALGLAERIGLPISEKTVQSSRWLPLTWQRPKLEGTPPLAAIGCGRAAIPYLLQMKRLGWATKTIYVQDPRVNPSNFDLVVAPEHDRLQGTNVVSTLGSVHRITPEKLTNEASQFSKELADLPRPHIAVLIGGRSKAFDFTEETAIKLAETLGVVEGSLLITASRRTGDAAKILQEKLPNSWVYLGEGPNPYFAFLETADHILVTEDSVNMVTEAAATGKPVYLLKQPVLNSRRAQKFHAYHDALIQQGRAQHFKGALEGTAQPPFDNCEKAVGRIKEMLEIG